MNTAGSQQDQVDKVSWELLDTYEALSTIYKSANLLAMSDGITQGAQITLDCALEITESDGGVVFIPYGKDFKLLASQNAGKAVHEAAKAIGIRHEGKAYYEDGLAEGIFAADGQQVQGRLHVPFSMGDQRNGLIYLFSTTDRIYSSIDIKRVQILCCQGALAIQCFLHMDELKEKNAALQSTLDQLTNAQAELVRSERLSTLGKMAAMIVHDIKNPMGGLLGYAQLLETMSEELSPEEIREYSGVIIKEMRRLSNMTEEIMEFSRGMESRLSPRPLTSKDLVAAAAPVIESELQGHGVTFYWDDLDSERIIMADSDKMERVFINMALNALHAMTKPGSVSICSTVIDDWLEYSIKDTGRGIPPEIRDNLFEPFVTRKEGLKCLGIGLAVSRWVVEAHGGYTWVHSTGEKGTEFKIRLPLRGPSGEHAEPHA